MSTVCRSNDVTAPSAKDEHFIGDWQTWRAHRLTALHAPDGPLTLVATYWLAETDVVPGVPGTWAKRGDSTTILLPPGVEVLVEGSRETGEVVALAPEKLLGPRLHFASVTAQVTRRQGQTGVRVFDHCLANRLEDLGTYPPDPSFVFAGQYEPGDEPSRVTYRYALEAMPRVADVPGRVRFSLGGREYVLYPLPDEGSLLLVFNDRTTGTGTRPPSRFLLIEPPATGLGHPGIVNLDFNRAFLPPCAFSNEFNCPLAPSHHKFDVEVTAGETWPRFSDLT
jgi:uncharacterized protein